METFFMPEEGKTALRLNHGWRNSQDPKIRKDLARQERGSGGPILRDPRASENRTQQQPYHTNARGGRGGNNNRGGIGRGDRGGFRGRGGRFNNNNFQSNSSDQFHQDHEQYAYDNYQQKQYQQPQPQTVWEANYSYNNDSNGNFGADQNQSDFGQWNQNINIGGRENGKVWRAPQPPVVPAVQLNEPESNSNFPPPFENEQFPSMSPSLPYFQTQAPPLPISQPSQSYSSAPFQLQQETSEPKSLQQENIPSLLDIPLPPQEPAWTNQQTQGLVPIPSLLSTNFHRPKPQDLVHGSASNRVTPVTAQVPCGPPPSLFPPEAISAFFQSAAQKSFLQQSKEYSSDQSAQTLYHQQIPAVPLPYEVSTNTKSMYRDAMPSVPNSDSWYNGFPIPQSNDNINIQDENSLDSSDDQNPWYQELIPNTRAARAKYFPNTLPGTVKPKINVQSQKKINPFAIPYKSSSGYQEIRGQSRQNEVVANPLFRSNYNNQNQNKNFNTMKQQSQFGAGPQPLKSVSTSVPLMDSDQLGVDNNPFDFFSCLQNQNKWKRKTRRGKGKGKQGTEKEPNLENANKVQLGVAIQTIQPNAFVAIKPISTYRSWQEQKSGQSSTITNRLLNMAQQNTGDGSVTGIHQSQGQGPNLHQRNIFANTNNTQTPQSKLLSSSFPAKKNTQSLLPTPKLTPYPPPPPAKPVERNPKGILKNSESLYSGSFVQQGHFANSGIVEYDEDDDDDDGIEFLENITGQGDSSSNTNDNSHDFFSEKMVQHFTSVLKGKTLEKQLEGLFGYVLLVPQFLTTRVGIVRNLHILLTEKYQKCTLQPYGADFIGVGNNDDSINIFVDLTGKQGPSSFVEPNSMASTLEITRQNVDELIALLRQDGEEHELFGQIVKRTNFGRISLPVISFVHKGSRVRCNIRLENYFLVQEAKLLQFLTSLDTRITPLLAITRYWSSVHKVLDTPEEDTKNRFITLLVMFFLARKKIVPTMAHLQSLAVKHEYFENTNIGFCDDYELVPKNENSVLEDKNIFTLSTLALLKEFFNLFSSANLKTEVVSMWKAEFIPKENFNPDLEGKMLAADLRKRYRYGVNGKLREKRLDCSSRLCLQDFHDLTENLTQAIPDYDVSKFQIECEIARSRLDTVMSSGSGEIMSLFEVTEYNTSNTP